MTKKTLIITVAGDLHSNAIQWALTQYDCDLHTWVVTDYPAGQTISQAVSDNNESLNIDDAVEHFQLIDFDVVWLRRFWKSPISMELHAADRAAASQAVDTVRRSLLSLIAPDAFWINPANTLRSAGDKPVQLSLARRLGLQIPNTLISNDPKAVRDFYQSCGAQIIYKPLDSMVWKNGETKRVTYTTALTEQDLSDDAAIQLCPAIFQQNITKAYEIRATFMGATCMAVKLETQGIDDVEQDWRHGSANGISLKPIPVELPQPVYERCREFMRHMNIVYGAFDFIVTPNAEYIFLEVNHGGQFLWVELENPDCPMLQVFSEFLLSANPDFEWDGKIKPQLSMAAYKASEHYQRFVQDPSQGHEPYEYQFNVEKSQAKATQSATQIQNQ